MIPLSAPSISASVAKANGAAPSASPKGAEPASFAAMLGASEVPAGTPEPPAADIAAALVAALAGLPGGKPGKAGGKDLPDGEQAVAGDLEKASEAPDEAGQDQADVPIAAAIPVLTLNVPPLPGIGNPVEFRAAVPDQAPARATLPAVPAQAAPAAQQAVQKQAVTRTAVPAQVLGIELAPIVTAEAQPVVDVEVLRVPAAVSTVPVSPEKVTMGHAQPLQTGNSKQDPLILSLSKEPGGAPGSFDKLRTSGEGADVTDSKPAAVLAPAPAAATRETSAALPSAKAAVASREAPAIVGRTADAGKRDNAEPNPAKERLATNAIGLDRAAEIAQPAPQHPMAQPTAARIADAATTPATPARAEQPHDFATLIDSLSQAREAASPQVVRTALQHAEFGRISLQFRHDDANLSVTMANADPAFNSAVHSAVAASLAGNAAGNGDQPRGDSQQQHQPASQQQSASSAGGNGQGQQQSAQGRSEPAERMFERAQGSSARAQGETASSARDGKGERRSGVYA